MAISLKHNFTSAVADELDTSLVRPSNWNAEHNLTLGTAKLVGRTTAGTGSAEEISVGTGLNLSSGSLAVSSTTPQVNSINTFTAAQVIEVTDNSNPALRITQLGTADALRIEDETSPDSTPFVITAKGHAIAGYGQTLAIETVEAQFQSHTDTLAEGGYGGADWGNTATGQVNWFAKSRGGSYGTQGILSSGDTIGDFRFYGSDGVNLIPAAKIEVDVDGTPGVNDMPGRIGFFTTADGEATSTERLRISSNGETKITGTGVVNANSSSAAFRITQLGTGEAIRVEDEANPDGTPFVVDASGNVGIGRTATTNPLTIYSATNSTLYLQGDSTTQFVVQRSSTDASSPVIDLRKTRGNTGVPTAVASGDGIGSVLFRAYGGANNRTISSITGAVDTYTSDTDISSTLRFSTSPSGSAAATERMRIDSSGNVGIGTSSPGNRLHVVATNASQIRVSEPTLAFYYDLGRDNVDGYFTINGNQGTGYKWQIAGTERFRIGISGQFGIGGANYGTAGQVLTSGGASAAPTWATPSAAAGGMFYENDITLTSNYTITTNKNAMTAGPVFINSGVVVTIPSGSVWTIV